MHWKKGEQMDERVKYYVETLTATMERTIRRLWILAIILVLLLVGTNAAWIWYESQFEEIVVTQKNEDGFNNYVGEDGNIRNIVGVDYGNADN